MTEKTPILKLQTINSQSWISNNNPSSGAESLYIDVNISAEQLLNNNNNNNHDDENSSSPPPLHISIAVDTSSSISGSKLANARRAIEFVASQLRSCDRLGVVTFSHKVQEVLPLCEMTQENKKKVRVALQDSTMMQESRSTTNLIAGLTRALEQVPTSSAPLFISDAVSKNNNNNNFSSNAAAATATTNNIKNIKKSVNSSYRASIRHAFDKTGENVIPKKQQSFSDTFPNCSHLVREFHGETQKEEMRKKNKSNNENENENTIEFVPNSRFYVVDIEPPQDCSFFEVSVFKTKTTNNNTNNNNEESVELFQNFEASGQTQFIFPPLSCCSSPSQQGEESHRLHHLVVDFYFSQEEAEEKVAKVEYSFNNDAPLKHQNFVLVPSSTKQKSQLFEKEGKREETETEATARQFFLPSSNNHVNNNNNNNNTEKPVVRAVFLFSDGVATNTNIPLSITYEAIRSTLRQVQKRNNLIQKPIVFSFALGTDSDSSNLRQLAEMTEGSFYYLENSAEKIPIFIADCLASLFSIVAMNLKLQIKTNERNVSIEEVCSHFSNNFKTHSSKNNNANNEGVTVCLKNIFQQEQKDIVVRLKFSSSSSSSSDEILFPISCFLEYINVFTNQIEKVEVMARIPVMRKQQHEHNNNAIIFDKNVHSIIQRYRTCLALEEVRKLADNNSMVAARERAETLIKTLREELDKIKLQDAKNSSSAAASSSSSTSASATSSTETCLAVSNTLKNVAFLATESTNPSETFKIAGGSHNLNAFVSQLNLQRSNEVKLGGNENNNSLFPKNEKRQEIQQQLKKF